MIDLNYLDGGDLTWIGIIRKHTNVTESDLEKGNMLDILTKLSRDCTNHWFGGLITLFVIWILMFLASFAVLSIAPNRENTASKVVPSYSFGIQTLRI